MTEYAEDLSRFHNRVEQRKERDKERADFPKQYINDNLRFTKINKNSKSPSGYEWNTKNTYQYNDDELISSIVERGMNYGVVCGYGSLIVIDWDSKDFYEKLKDKLPNTFQTQSPSYKSCPHSYYYIEDREQPQGFRLLDDKRDTLADIQGKGTCVVAVKSTHPDHIDGEPYKVVNDIPITTIKWEDIIEVFEPYINENTNFTGKPREKREYEPRDNDLVEKIKTAIPIDVALQKFGIDTSNNSTRCPFHDSKKGKCLSFNTSENTWHCFHCGQGGDIFNLYAISMGLDTNDKDDFKTLLEHICNEAGIEYKRNENEQTETQDPQEIINKLKSICISGFDLCNEDIEPDEFYLYPLLKKNSVNIISGDTGSGKTLFILSMCKAIQEHTDFLHFKNVYDATTKVLFVDGEMGRKEMHHRLIRMNYNNPNFYLLSKTDCYDKGIEVISISNRAYQEYLTMVFDSIKPDIIIFDNLFSLVEGSANLNDAQDAMVVSAFFSRLKEHYTIIGVHHFNKAKKGYFGSIANITAADTSYELTKLDDETIKVKFHQKKYRPLLTDGKDRKLLSNQKFIFNEVLQEWEHMTGGNMQGYDDTTIIRMLCTYDITNNGKLKKRYKQEEIKDATGVSVRTINRKIDELAEKDIIYSKSRNEKYMTENGSINYIRYEEPNTYEIRETLVDNRRLYYFTEKDIDTLDNVVVDYQGECRNEM